MEAGMLPQTITESIDAPPVLAAPLDSSRLIVAMESFRGSVEPTRFGSPRDLGRYIERTGVGIPVWDTIDAALREGVPEVWLARILGPAAVKASLALAGASGTSFTVTAHEPGEWANGATGGLTAEVVNGPAGASERVVIIRRASSGEEVGRTGAYTTRAELMAAVARIGEQTRPMPFGPAQIVPLLEAAAGAELGLPTVVGPANLAGGTSDAGAITGDHLRIALDRVPVEYGPMSVVAPGRSTDSSNIEVLEYAQAARRTALLEQAGGLSRSAIQASLSAIRAATIRGAEGFSRLGGVWPNHLTGPGLTPGTTRTVPATVVVAGLTARLQRAEGHPNVAPFGDFGVPRWATGIADPFTEADAVALFDSGANVFTDYLGVPRNRSFRSLELDGSSEWVDLAHARTDRQIHAIAHDVGRAMGSRVISRQTIADFGSRLRSRLVDELYKRGALFGDTADEAVRVDTESVNDTTSIAAREVNAAVGARMSEHAEFVRVEIAKVPIGQEV
jgi:hypothetical protein